jgi:hypothetical protein
MNRIFAALTSFLLFLLSACDTGTGENIRQPDANTPVPQTTPSLATFTDTLNKLGGNQSQAVPQAIELYGLLAPHDSTGADSAASALLRFVNGVVKNANDSLSRASMEMAALLNPAGNTLSEKQKAIKTNLHANRMKLVSDGEGGAYVVPAYETILPTIKAKTSTAVDDFLDLAAKEDTTPVFRDAGIAIDMTELIDRLVKSEQLTDESLPKQLAAEAARLNQFYTNALINGADNSPALAFESTTLNEEFRKGYDYLLAKYPSSKAAAKINVWQTVVASGDRKKIEDFRRTIQ